MPALIYTSYISHLLDLSGNPLLGSCMFLKPVRSVKPLWVLPLLAAASGCAQGPLCLTCRPTAASGCRVVGWPVGRELRGCKCCPCSKEQTRTLREAGREAPGGRERACTAPGSLSHPWVVLKGECFLNRGPVSPVPHPPATPCWEEFGSLTVPHRHWKQLFGAPWAAPSPGWSSPDPPASAPRGMLQPQLCLCPSTEPTLICQCFLLVTGPKPDCAVRWHTSDTEPDLPMGQTHFLKILSGAKSGSIKYFGQLWDP